MNGVCIQYGRRRRSQVASAASAHGPFFPRRSLRGVSTSPPYCFYENGALKYNADGSNTGICSASDACICRTAVTAAAVTAPARIATTLKGSKLSTLSTSEKDALKLAMKARIASSSSRINAADVTDVVLTSDSKGNIVATAVLAPHVQSADADASVAVLKTNKAALKIGTKSFTPMSTGVVEPDPPPPSATVVIIVIVIVVVIICILVAIVLFNKNKNKEQQQVGSAQEAGADWRPSGAQSPKPKARLKPPTLPSASRGSEWMVLRDPASGRDYYRNERTRETTWKVPG